MTAPGIRNRSAAGFAGIRRTPCTGRGRHLPVQAAEQPDGESPKIRKIPNSKGNLSKRYGTLDGQKKAHKKR